ncbi:dTDP-glucose 4,6-dehydratase [Patescibacteria group bacterium]|nr:dTDP-glucose 4,6-dehydratase [Patescibacteria group bacterium]
MKLLITGGAGFIGSNFIHYWLKNHPDDKIVNLDKLTYCGNLENLQSIEKNPNYKFVKGDICDLNLVGTILQENKIDTIVHFAAQSHVDQSILNIDKEGRESNETIQKLFEHSLPYDFVLNNTWGTHVLLEAAVKAWRGEEFRNKKFHHISTDEVFGALPLDDAGKFSESTKYDPRSPYSASKAASDHLVSAYYTTYGLPVTITNTSNNYGPYQYPEKLLPLAITNLLENKKVPIYGDGKYVRDWLYVEDHCRAIELVLEKAKIGETYLIGGLTEDVNNLELINRVLAIMGKSEEMLEYVKDRPGHDRRYAVDWTKAKNELDYKPLYGLDTYLEKTINWYKENESWWKRIKSGDYLKYYKKQYEKR